MLAWIVCFLPEGSINRQVSSSTEAEIIWSLGWVLGNVASKLLISAFSAFIHAMMVQNSLFWCLLNLWLKKKWQKILTPCFEIEVLKSPFKAVENYNFKPTSFKISVMMCFWRPKMSMILRFHIWKSEICSIGHFWEAKISIW